MKNWIKAILTVVSMTGFVYLLFYLGYLVCDRFNIRGTDLALFLIVGGSFLGITCFVKAAYDEDSL